ncbi:MAG TPA: DUF2070 family protein [Thermoplasmata archaeon]|nr:DUF2070 family protein [Thermoplasmata archaeon]
MAADPLPVAPQPPNSPTRRYVRLIFRAPSPRVTSGLLLVVLLVLATLAWYPAGYPQPFLTGLVLVFLFPAMVAVALSTPLAASLGGEFVWRRSVLLALMSAMLAVPLLIVWRAVDTLPAVASIPEAAILLLLQGPMLWFRHMTIFGVSRSSHARSLPVSALPPAVAVVMTFVVYPWSGPLVVAALLDLLLGFGCAALLLRAADRPLRREFSISGVSLIRPLLDHVNRRDPAATEAIESFFKRFAFPADLRVTLLSFRRGSEPVATIALPTVHPGPFAALGASDLPRKLAEALGPAAGTVLVPHTPCNHDLDLPSGAEVRQVADAARALLRELGAPAASGSSPLVGGRPGAIAKAQALGDTVLVVVTQAPAPTDDIDFSVADQLYREFSPSVHLAIVDAHNSYVEGQGDLIYGTPSAAQMLADARGSIAEARRLRVPGPVEAGVAVREGYSIGAHGIGPTGIRALVLRAAGTTTAYVLIDGNNLLKGMRARILEALTPLVDVAEVMTTDNHVVHEVDGGINPVGERYPVESLAADIRSLVAEAKARLAPVEVRAGTAPVPSVPVLGPGWTARLLTSLGDTVSMFANALLTTFLLLLAGSVIVLLAIR